LGARIGAALSFLDSELSALPDGVIEGFLASEPGLETYRLQLELLLRDRPHLLGAETEQTLAAPLTPLPNAAILTCPASVPTVRSGRAAAAAAAEERVAGRAAW
jgi:hypothetical protein